MRHAVSRRGYHYIEVAPGVRLFSIRFYCDALGLTDRQFTKQCNDLKVPLLYMGDRVYVRYESLMKAFAFITEVGQPNFLGVGRESRKARAQAKRYSRANAYASEMDVEAFFKDEERVIQTIVAGLRVHGRQTTRKAETELRQAYRDWKQSVLLVANTLSEKKDAGDPGQHAGPQEGGLDRPG